MARLLLFAYIVAVCMSASATRTVLPLNLGWEFRADDGRCGKVNLPHDFQISQPWVAPSPTEKNNLADDAANAKSMLSPRGFKAMGRAEYIKTLHIPDSLRGKRLLLDFGGIMLTGDVYLNGRLIGGTDYGYLGFECDITKTALYGQDNTIRVMADTGKPENSRWYTGGGLYRTVNLIITDKDLHFNRHGLNIQPMPQPDGTYLLQINADLNAAKPNKRFLAHTEVADPKGRIVGSRTDTIDILPKWRDREYRLPDIEIGDPMLWDCENPNLYDVTVAILREDGSAADTMSRRIGLRHFDFSPRHGFRLNGKRITLKGIANHHTLGALGAAAYPAAIEKRIRLLKEFGFNHIRTAHNPYSQEFLDLCDSYGILVVDELYDKWLTKFAGGRKDWAEIWQHDVEEWVKRDRNHPCVVIWSLGNELQGYSSLPYNDWGVTAYKLMKTLLQRYDTIRPVTVAMHPRYRSLATDSLPAPLALATDIAAYNYRYMYFPGDAARFPDLIFYQSEANLANMGPNYFIPSESSRVIGLAYWGMIDYLGESLGWPAKGWTDGVFDISLNPKPTAWLVKSMFSDEPTVRIAIKSPGGKVEDWNGETIGGEVFTDSWNHSLGDTLSVTTYTNAEEVELRLNGRSLGRLRNDLTDPSARNRIVWPGIPFKPGKLEAIAYKEGKTVCRHSIETAGKPVRLIAEPDKADWTADGMDLQHIRVTAVDSRGRKVPYADDELEFHLTGDAEIIAVSNGDNTSDEPLTGNRRSLYKGQALLILRAGQSPADVALTIKSERYPILRVALSTR